MLSLEILICTIDDGIVRAASVPCAPLKGVSYLISWQQSQPNQPQVPASLLERDDIRIVTLQAAAFRATVTTRWHTLRATSF